MDITIQEIQSIRMLAEYLRTFHIATSIRYEYLKQNIANYTPKLGDMHATSYMMNYIFLRPQLRWGGGQARPV